MSNPVTFQDAIAKCAEWIRLWDAEELSDDVLADYVGELVREREGARGFFVASLTGESPLMDRLPEALVLKLREAGLEVVDLTARNLAMSTAMGVMHKRTNDDEMLSGSERVQLRSLELLRQLDPNLVKERLEKLLEGLEGRGEDHQFLERWGYDAEQKQAIKTIILSVAE